MRLPPPQSLPPRPPPQHAPLSSMLKSPTSKLSSPGAWTTKKGQNGKNNQSRSPATPDTTVMSSSEMSYVDEEDEEVVVVHRPSFASSLDKQEDTNTASSSSGHDEIEEKLHLFLTRHSRHVAIQNSEYNHNNNISTPNAVPKEGIGNRQSRIVAAVAAAALERSPVAAIKACATATSSAATMTTEENVVGVNNNVVATTAVPRLSLLEKAALKSHTKAVNNDNSTDDDTDATKTSFHLLPRDNFGRIKKINVEKESLDVQQQAKEEEVVKYSGGEISLKSTSAAIEELTSDIAGVTKQQRDDGVAVIDRSIQTRHEAFQQDLLTELKEETSKSSDRVGLAVVTDAPCISSVVTTESHSLTVTNNETCLLVAATPSNIPTNISSNPTTTTMLAVESPLSSDDAIIHSGWLRKKTKHGKWVRRYFVINSTGAIHYSHSESECGKMIRLVTGCARIERVKSIPTEFRLYSRSSSSSSTQLAATLRARNVNDTICWVETIDRISEQRRRRQQQQQHKCLLHVDNNQEMKSDNIVTTMHGQSSIFVDNSTELTAKIQMPIVLEALPPDVPITNDNDDDDDNPTIEADMTENVEKRDETAPIETPVTILNELIASPTAHSTKIDFIEEENDKKSNEPDPRAALMLMLNARSNLLSSKSETRSKAVENDSEQEHPEDEIDIVPKLKEDPVYEKYYKMLKVGLPMGAVRNAMTRDKLDPTVLDLDPEKSLESQRQPVAVPQLQEDPVVNDDAPIKDNPNLAKYHKMLKMGLPVGAVLNALKRDGVDPALMNLGLSKDLAPNVNPIPNIRRKKVYWNQVDAKDGNLWSAVKKLDLKLRHHSSFEGLFTQAINADKEKEEKEASQSPNKSAKTVKVIDPKRGMNGDIILRKVKYSPLELSAMVEHLDCGRMDSHELKSLYEYLPTKEETKQIRAYLMKSKSQNDAVVDLTPTEQYMLALLNVVDYEKKFLCLIFLSEYQIKMAELKYDVDQLRAACKELKTSKTFLELLAFILRLVNEINYGVEGCATVEGFTLDSLSKLSETKAFDNKTSVLEYLVKVIRQTNKDVLKFQEEIKSVVIAKGVAIERLLTSVKQLCVDSKTVSETATKHGDEYRKYAKDPTQKVKYRDVKSQRASVKELRQMIAFIDEKDVPVGRIDTTHFERFALLAKLELQEAVDVIREANNDYIALLQYFGEDLNLPAADFFGMISQFMDAFDLASVMVEREEERKLMEARRALAREAKQRVKSIARVLQQTDVGKTGRKQRPPPPKHPELLSTPSHAVAKENKVPCTTDGNPITSPLAQDNIDAHNIKSNNSLVAEAAQNKILMKAEKMESHVTASLLNNMAASAAQTWEREHISLYHARTNQSNQSGAAEKAVKSERAVKSNGSIRKTSRLSLAVAAAAQRSRVSVPL